MGTVQGGEFEGKTQTLCVSIIAEAGETCNTKMEDYMTEMQKKALALIEKQQKGLNEYQPAYMVGEQLKDIIRREPESAEFLAHDLEKPAMGIQDAEKRIKAEADKHKKGGSACVPPWIAEDILRQFYGLPERTWGPGKENVKKERVAAASDPSGRLPSKGKTGIGKVIDLADFF